MSNPFFYFSFQEKTPLPAFAKQPAPGMMMDLTAVSNEFYRIYFDLLESKPFQSGVMTPESCLETYRMAAWGNFFGLKVSPVGEMRDATGITAADLKATYQSMMTMLMTGAAKDEQWAPCFAALNALDQLWSYQIDLTSLYKFARYWKEQRFQFTGRDFLWGIIPAYSADGMIGNALVDIPEGLMYKAPQVHLQIRYPREWGANEGGFAFKIPYPSRLKIKAPKSVRYKPEVVEETHKDPLGLM